MSEPDRPLFHLEITDDATTGMSIRLRHSGHIPNVLAGIPKDVLRKARPWIWNSYERAVLRKARSMNRHSYRLIRDTLILERSKMIIAQSQQRTVAKKQSFLERRRLWQQHKTFVQQLGPAERATRTVALRMKAAGQEPQFPVAPTHKPTLTEAMRDLTKTDLSDPRPRDPRYRVR